MSSLTIETPGETQIILRRIFAAPPADVFRAHVDPALIRQWMNVLPGWTMPEAETDPRPGGTFRFRWDDGRGNGFRIEGEYVEVEEGRRILHAERMFVPERTAWSRVETLFQPHGGGTSLVLTMTLPSASARTAMLQTGMTEGMTKTYDQLDALLLGRH
jgi:uncharacterized protein YndB with AHSA1/START domain